MKIFEFEGYLDAHILDYYNHLQPYLKYRGNFHIILIMSYVFL